MARKAAGKRRLKLAIFNNSGAVLKMLCDWFNEHGHDCVPALLSEVRNANEDVPRLISKHRPDVVVYDIGMPYESSWDLLAAIRSGPELQGYVVRLDDAKQAQPERRCRARRSDRNFRSAQGPRNSA